MRILLATFFAGLLAANISCTAHQHRSAPVVAAAPSLPEMIDRVRGSVVGIIVSVDPRQPPVPKTPGFGCFINGKCVVGTGFFVSDKADVVTASHVAGGTKTVLQMLQAVNLRAKAFLEIDLPNFEGQHGTSIHNYMAFDFQIRAEDHLHDIAVLSPTVPNLFEQARQPLIKGPETVPTSNPSAVTFDKTRPRDGEDVFACGYPVYAQDLTTTSGHVANAWASEILIHARDNGLSESVDVYRLDLSGTLGNSGGPAFLAKNQDVIGMVIQLEGVSGIGGSTATAIPARYITEMLDKNQIPWKPSSKGK